MDVYVGSNNGHKIAAARLAVGEIFSGQLASIQGRKVDEGLPAQVEGLEATLAATFERLRVLKEQLSKTKYDLLIAMQDGIHTQSIAGEDHTFNTAWIIVEDADGNQSITHSTGIPFEQADVEAARQRGFATTTVGSIIAERTGSNPTNPHSKLTEGVLSRTEVLTQSIRAAIGQLLSKSQALAALTDEENA